MPTQTKNYIITNREDESYKTIAPGGALTYTTALATGTTSSSFSSDPEFTTSLENDLTTVANGADTVSLCVYIHGFDSPWTTVDVPFFGTSVGIEQLAPLWFANLRDPGGYAGVLLAFDWPSGEDVLDFSTAKANATTTAQQSLPLLVTYLNGVIADMQAQGITVQLQLVCHSMGNYLIQQTADATFPPNYFTQTLLVAPELSPTTFSTTVTSKTPGAVIVAASEQITVYFSSQDDVLPNAVVFDDWGGELGLSGPTYADTVAANVTGLDCSAVVNSSNQGSAGSIHTSYFYIPETLQDMALTLMGQPSNFRSGTAPELSLVCDPSTGASCSQSAATSAAIRAS